jgi:RND superfamily putative drug exporter
MLEKLTQASVRRTAAVLIIWLSLALAGAFSSIHLSDRLTTTLEIPGSGSARAEKVLNAEFQENSEGLITILNKFGNLSSDEIANLKEETAKAARVVPESRVISQQALVGTLFTVIATNNSLPVTAKSIEPLRKELDRQGIEKALVSGPPAIFSDVKPVLANDLRRGELIAIILALFLLVIALGFSWSIFIPLIFASVTVSTVLLIVSWLSHQMAMVLYIPNIVELIGFGLAIDYSLLALHRFREEVRNHPEAELKELIALTMQSAGKTILISSTTVAVALSTLLFFPIPFIRSLGIAGVLVPIIASLVAMTLLPVLLTLFGKGGNSAHRYQGILSRSDSHSRATARLSKLLLTKPKLVFFSTLSLLFVMILPIFSLQLTPSSLTAIPQNLESSQALNYLTSRGGEGVITPIAVIVDLGSAQSAQKIQNSEDRIALAKRISRDPEVLSVAQGEKAPFIDETGRFYRIFIFGKSAVGAQETHNLVERVRDSYLPQSKLADRASFYLGGAPVQGVDLLSSITHSAPAIFTGALILIFLLLGWALKSIVIPLKAILLDVISIAVSVGLLVAFFKFGIGAQFFGTYQLAQIEVWALLFLVVILFGISMDYEVFIVSRILESRSAGALNETAVIDGFTRTIRVVTTAAAIFIAAVSGFITGHFAGLQELGVGLVFAVLIDATLIRLLLLPSAMILLGDANWWWPNRKSRHLAR